MKKFYFIAAALLMFSVTASAQFVNSSKSSSNASIAVEDVFNTAEFTYSPANMVLSYDGDSDSEGMNALSLTWLQARRLPVNNLPLYVQYGAGLQWAFETESETDGDAKLKNSMNFLTVKVPVNVLYDFQIPSTPVNIMPYLGLNLQCHVIGSEKMSYTYDGETESESYSYFSKDDMEDMYGKAFNRIVLGWQIGAKVAYDKYFFGIAYEGPVTNLYKNGDAKINFNYVNISLGIRF